MLEPNTPCEDTAVRTTFVKNLMALVVLLLAASTSQAADSWTNQTINGTLMAITPTYKLQVYQLANPSESVWGRINIPISAEQLPELHKHRKSPNFPFIDVAVEVDKYYRTAQGHIHDDTKLITVEIDRRHWDGLKQGNHLIIRLPDNTELKESLKDRKNKAPFR
tara:strand:+ start:392 stop:886 length:495 start_codon:yes stop_codon:yes gene_type:complete